MYLTDIVEHVTQALNDLPPGNWKGLRPVEDFEFKKVIHPHFFLTEPDLRVYIMPDVYSFSREDSSSRGQKKWIRIGKGTTIAVSQAFSGWSNGVDITSWEDGKVLYDLVEDIIRNCFMLDIPGVEAPDIESVSPIELELEDAHFLTLVQLEWPTECGFTLSSGNLNVGSGLAQTGDCIESADSSDLLAFKRSELEKARRRLTGQSTPTQGVASE